MAYTFLHKFNEGKLESVGVKDQREMKQFLSDGWFRSPEEAQGEKQEENDVLELLKGKSAEEIKENLTVEELRDIAKKLKIRGVSKDNEDTLIEKILEKVE